ncbi:MAG: ArsC family (seleno)protein [Gemmatimonadetes bacterium]|nr:ArsC family (seleno)protein [Candidatus Palauibacter rhopaloidicola]
MFEEIGATIAEERSATKAPLTDDDVRELLAAAERVVIARGRSRRDLDPGETELDALKGPTGKYRAPIVLAGTTLLVGFNAEALAEL